LWEEEVRQGRRETVPTRGQLGGRLSGFDWASRSRISDDVRGGIVGAVLVSDRSTPAGTMTRIEVAAAGSEADDVTAELTRWGLGYRRLGLASWLVAEALARLHRAGARIASLYADGRNETGAAGVYRKLGFEVAFETEVWEATFR
jgi:GNAT superfamily N-acetyltransferase